MSYQQQKQQQKYVRHSQSIASVNSVNNGYNHHHHHNNSNNHHSSIFDPNQIYTQDIAPPQLPNNSNNRNNFDDRSRKNNEDSGFFFWRKQQRNDGIPTAANNGHNNVGYGTAGQDYRLNNKNKQEQHASLLSPTSNAIGHPSNIDGEDDDFQRLYHSPDRIGLGGSLFSNPVTRTVIATISHTVGVGILCLAFAMHNATLGVCVVELVLLCFVAIMSDYILVVACEHTKQFSQQSLLSYCICGSPENMFDTPLVSRNFGNSGGGNTNQRDDAPAATAASGEGTKIDKNNNNPVIDSMNSDQKNGDNQTDDHQSAADNDDEDRLPSNDYYYYYNQQAGGKESKDEKRRRHEQQRQQEENAITKLLKGKSGADENANNTDDHHRNQHHHQTVANNSIATNGNIKKHRQNQGLAPPVHSMGVFGQNSVLSGYTISGSLDASTNATPIHQHQQKTRKTISKDTKTKINSNSIEKKKNNHKQQTSSTIVSTSTAIPSSTKASSSSDDDDEDEKEDVVDQQSRRFFMKNTNGGGASLSSSGATTTLSSNKKTSTMKQNLTDHDSNSKTKNSSNKNTNNRVVSSPSNSISKKSFFSSSFFSRSNHQQADDDDDGDGESDNNDSGDNFTNDDDDDDGSNNKTKNSNNGHSYSFLNQQQHSNYYSRNRAFLRKYRQALEDVAYYRKATLVVCDTVLLIGALCMLVAYSRVIVTCCSAVLYKMGVPPTSPWVGGAAVPWFVVWGCLFFVILSWKRILFEPPLVAAVKVGCIVFLVLCMVIQYGQVYYSKNIESNNNNNNNNNPPAKSGEKHIRYWGFYQESLSALATLSLVCSYHVQTPVLYSLIQPRSPTAKMKAAWISNPITTLFFIMTGLIGYLSFGDLVARDNNNYDIGDREDLWLMNDGGDILNQYPRDSSLFTAARAIMILHFAIAFPVLAISVRESIHRLVLVLCGRSSGIRDMNDVLKTGRLALVVEALLLVLFVQVVAATVPGIGIVLNLGGAISSSFSFLIVPGIVGIYVFEEVDPEKDAFDFDDTRSSRSRATNLVTNGSPILSSEIGGGGAKQPQERNHQKQQMDEGDEEASIASPTRSSLPSASASRANNNNDIDDDDAKTRSSSYVGGYQGNHDDVSSSVAGRRSRYADSVLRSAKRNDFTGGLCGVRISAHTMRYICKAMLGFGVIVTVGGTISSFLLF